MGRPSRRALPPPATSPLWNTAIYARLSQRDAGQSIQTQVTLAHAYLENQSDLCLVGTFIDEGQSGVNFQRPAWAKLWQAIEAKEVNCLLCKDLSRLGRNHHAMGHLLWETLPQLGVRLIALAEGYDSQNPQPERAFLLPFFTLQQAHYARDIGRKISAVLDVQKRAGQFLGKLPPYGYCLHPPHQLQIHPQRAEIVRGIFAGFCEGWGTTALARRLNDADIPSQAQLQGDCAALWSGTAVGDLLRNPVYTGAQVYRKGWQVLGNERRQVLPKADWILLPHCHEALVSEEIFQAVQGRFSPAPVRNPLPNPLRGLLFCGACGARLQRDSGYLPKGASQRQYRFRCPRKYKQSHVCTCPSVPEKTVFSLLSCFSAVFARSPARFVRGIHVFPHFCLLVLQIPADF